MFLAYFIYTTLLFLLFFGGIILNKVPKSQGNIIFTVTIFICALVLGLRYNVGVDYASYKIIYENLSIDRLEIGYQFLCIVFNSLGFPFPVLTTFIAFLQLYLFYIGLKDYKSLLPWIFFFYFTTLYIFVSLNGMRQTLAFSIFVYSLHFIRDKKLLKYAITILIATSFHKSAIIFIPLYFILNYEIFRSKNLQYILLITTILFSYIFSDSIWQIASFVSPYIGYGTEDYDLEKFKDIDWSGSGAGLGVYMWAIINLIVISCYNNIKKIFPDKFFIIIYNLYFIGTLIGNIVSGTYLSRANLYFLNIRIIVYAYLLVYFLHCRNTVSTKLLSVFIVLIMLAFFFLAISNKASMCAPYQFI